MFQPLEETNFPGKTTGQRVVFNFQMYVTYITLILPQKHRPAPEKQGGRQMFFRKITTRTEGKEYTYVKLIENYRQGSQIKQRVIANLGKIEELTPFKVHSLINSLSRVCGLDSPLTTKPRVKRILRYGDVAFVHKIWERLGLEAVLKSLPGAEPGLPQAVEILILAELLRLPPVLLRDWPRHLYLPAPSGQERQFLPGDVFSFLGNNEELLQESVLSRLDERGELHPPLYSFLARGQLGKSDRSRPHPAGAPRSRAFTVFVTVNRAGIPVMCRGPLEDPKTLFLFSAERSKAGPASPVPFKPVYVASFPAPCFPEYITLLTPAAPEREELAGRGLLDVFPDGCAPLEEGILYKEIPCPEGRYIIFRDTADFSAAAVLKTNVKDSSCPEIIRAYREVAALQRRFRLREDVFSGSTNYLSGVQAKGRLLAFWLALLTEKTGEQMLRKAGINLSASEALQILEPVKIAVLESGSEVFLRSVPLDKTQRKILASLDEEKARSESSEIAAGQA